MPWKCKAQQNVIGQRTQVADLSIMNTDYKATERKNSHWIIKLKTSIVLKMWHVLF